MLLVKVEAWRYCTFVSLRLRFSPTGCSTGALQLWGSLVCPTRGVVSCPLGIMMIRLVGRTSNLELKVF